MVMMNAFFLLVIFGCLSYSIQNCFHNQQKQYSAIKNKGIKQEDILVLVLFLLKLLPL